MSARHVTEEEVLQTYTLEVLGPQNADGSLPTVRFLPDFIQEMEENVTDLLAPGFSVRIREWDAKEETPNERS